MLSPEHVKDNSWREVQSLFVRDTIEDLRRELGNDFLSVGGRLAGYCLGCLGQYAKFTVTPNDCYMGLSTLLGIVYQDDEPIWDKLVDKIRTFCSDLGTNGDAYMAYIMSRVAEELATAVHVQARLPWSKAYPLNS